MENKKTVFNSIFKDYNYEDWQMTLHTSEPKTNREIEEIINNCIDMLNALGANEREDYSPVDIMDRICEDIQDEGRDWYWTDMDWDAIVIDDWQ